MSPAGRTSSRAAPFIGAKQIRDVSIHKATNLYDILRYSSNIGMSRIALRMPAQEMINT